MDPLIIEQLHKTRIEVLLEEAQAASILGDRRWVSVLSNLHSIEEVHCAGRMGAAVNALMSDGNGVLAKVINFYPLPMIRALLEIGLDPNQAIDGASPLFACMTSKSIAKMNLLIEAGSDPRACKAGRSLLYHALFESSFAFARKLHAYAPAFVGEQQDGKTLLHAFLEYRHFRACQDSLWFARKLLPDEQFFVADASGVSPAMLARELIEKLRPSPNTEALKALLFARLENQPLPKTKKTLLVSKARPVILPPTKFGLMLAKNRREVKRCLREGWDIEGADDRGRTILWHMAHRGAKNACVHLLERGASMESVDAQSKDSVLHRVCAHNMPKALALGLAQGADHALRNEVGRTPIFGAVEQGHWKVVGQLLEAGADPTVVDWVGCGLIDILLGCLNEKGVLNTLPLLMKAGLDPSPLHQIKSFPSMRLTQVLSRFAPVATAIFQSDQLRQKVPSSASLCRPRF